MAKFFGRKTMSNQFWRRVANALSVIIYCLLVFVAMNVAYLKNPLVEQILWICFAIWVGLFFIYLTAKVVSGRRSPEENLIKSDKWSSDIGGRLKIYD